MPSNPHPKEVSQPDRSTESPLPTPSTLTASEQAQLSSEPKISPEHQQKLAGTAVKGSLQDQINQRAEKIYVDYHARNIAYGLIARDRRQGSGEAAPSTQKNTPLVDSELDRIIRQKKLEEKTIRDVEKEKQELLKVVRREAKKAATMLARRGQNPDTTLRTPISLVRNQKTGILEVEESEPKAVWVVHGWKYWNREWTHNPVGGTDFYGQPVSLSKKGWAIDEHGEIYTFNYIKAVNEDPTNKDYLMLQKLGEKQWGEGMMDPFEQLIDASAEITPRDDRTFEDIDNAKTNLVKSLGILVSQKS